MSFLLSSILILIFLPFTCLLFIYVFTIQYSLLCIHYYVFTITYLLFVYLFTIYFTMHYALCTMHYALFTMYYALCIIYYTLCTIHCLLFIRIHTYSLFYTYSYAFTISRD